MISKHAKEAQLQQIFRLLLESKTQEEIAHQLNIGLRTVQRYTTELDKRYGSAQRQKTDDTLFLECQLFKNRMLTLYKILESKATDLKVSGNETAKCCEVAANIAIDVLKMESEGIKAVKELGAYGKANRLFNAIQSKYEHQQQREQQDLRDNNIIPTTEESESNESTTRSSSNRKF